MSRQAHSSKIPFGPDQRPWSEGVPEGAMVSGPEENPIPVYPAVPPDGLGEDFPALDYRKFELPPEGLTPRQRLVALAELERFIKTQQINFTGFQVNEDLDNQVLSWMLDVHANNVGDPFSSGYMTLNTKLVERSVLDYFASLWNARWPHLEQGNDPAEPEATERYWGYVLSMGSTEGNLYGVYNARNYLDGSALLHEDRLPQKAATLGRGKMVPVGRPGFLSPEDAGSVQYTPVAFYSEDTHYSVIKAMNVMHVKTFHDVATKNGWTCPLVEYAQAGTWPTEVPSRDYGSDPRSGSIKVEDLESLITPFIEAGYPPLIVLNVGSTWKGAYDDVREVDAMMRRLAQRYPWLNERKVTYADASGGTVCDIRRGYWVHVDAALGGAYLPFFEMAYHQKRLSYTGPIFDFRNEAVSSICCSVHKWIGCPWPGGVYLTKTKYQTRPPSTAGYIGSPDTTLGGSRNAFTPVLLWSYLARTGYEANMQRALECERTAAYLEEQLKALEAEIREVDPAADLWVHRSKLSLAVTFRMVNPTIAYKYTVDGERLTVPLDKTMCEDRTMAHCFAMKSLGSFEIVDNLIRDIREVVEKDGWKAAFPEAKNKTIDGLANPDKLRPIDP